MLAANKPMLGLAARVGFSVSIDPDDRSIRLCRLRLQRLSSASWARRIFCSRGGRARLLSRLGLHGLVALDRRALSRDAAGLLSSTEVEAIRGRIAALTSLPARPKLNRNDFLGALAIFLIVVPSTFPLVLPFVLIADVATAKTVSRAIALAMLFFGGLALGRYADYGSWKIGIMNGGGSTSTSRLNSCAISTRGPTVISTPGASWASGRPSGCAPGLRSPLRRKAFTSDENTRATGMG